MKKFIFWALASHGEGISGGDRIYIEFAKHWSKTYPVTIITWREGVEMMKRNGLTSGPNLSFSIIPIARMGFILSYLTRIVVGIYTALTLRVEDPAETYLYTASEFWMDSIPSTILKLRYSTLTWVATWYQTAPSPLRGFSDGSRSQAYRLNAFLLWTVQLLVKPLINSLADTVLVNNELEKAAYPAKQTVVVLGAVDITSIDAYCKNRRVTKRYSAVFQGRFHPQKGVIELVDIWQRVVFKDKNATLVMIGDGPLMPRVMDRIKKLKLENNIGLLGFVFDGEKKYKIFSQSLMAVHPAFFDSGGMATAEAMAFGIPAIGFDLPAYRTYYPVGMIKVPTGDQDAFANAVLGLLNNSALRKNLGKQAGEFIHKSYSWDYRSSQILRQIVEKTGLEKGRIAPQ